MASAKIQLTREELKELIRQYRIMRELLETWPKRKIMMNYEKDWNDKREKFLTEHPKIQKLFIKKSNSNFP